MAAVTPTPQARRKKQTVYGKSSGKPYSPAGTGFFEDDETTWAAVARAPRKYTTTIPARLAKPVISEPAAQPKSPVKKPGALPKTKKPPPRVKDTYDVPSDDEDPEVFSQIRLPPKQRIQSHLLDEPKEEIEQLAPWEKKAAKKNNAPSSLIARSSRSRAAVKEVGIG